MVVKRKISKSKYIIAGALTILIFALGIALGMLLDNERLRWLEDVSKEQELTLKSSQFQYLYLKTLKDEESSCPILQSTLGKTVTDLSQSLDTIKQFSQESTINDEDYLFIRRNYLLDNVNYWLLAEQSRATCGLNVVNILYFFKEDCETCQNQGVILTYFKNVFGDKLLVFPIDVDLAQSEPTVNVLLARYNVSTYPSIVVEDEKFEGVIMPPELKEIICSNFEENETDC